MLLNKYLLTLVVYFLLLLCTLTSSAIAQQERRLSPCACPTLVAINETAAPLDSWKVVPGVRSRKFERISIFNRNSDGMEFELAPDEHTKNGNRITQNWNLKGYRTMKVFIRCRYHDTSVNLEMDLPPNVETCTLRFVSGKSAIIEGSSDMYCQ